MSFPASPLRRLLVTVLAAAALNPVLSATAAEPVRIRFTLDWRFEGPTAPALMAKAKNYFSAEGLEVEIDAGSGSAAAVTRVATGAYDMGFADFNALIEQEAKTPGTGIKAVYMVYNTTPAAIFLDKKAGVSTPASLAGKTLAAPVFDGGRKSWPIFARANGLAVDAVKWQTVEPAIRETLLARGSVDGITGFYFTSLLNLEARGVKPEQLTVLRYADHGVELYGNAIIASPKMLKEQPEAVKGFLRAFNKALKETVTNPDAAVAYVKERDPLVNVELESRRLKLALENVHPTAETKKLGLGAVDGERLARSITQVVEAFELGKQPEAKALFSADFLPPLAERMVRPAGDAR